MSTEILESPEIRYEPRESFEHYRALSAAAVVSLLLGVISLSGILFAPLLVIAVVGLVLSIYALATVARSTEFSGKTPALVGLLLAFGSLVVGAPMHVYAYLSEVQPGFARVSFAELQPDRKFPHLPIPPSALELNGQKVFIKGYIHPLAGTGPIRQFTLVPDMGTCCFGGQPKLTDMIEVRMPESLAPTRYSPYKRKLHGTLTVHAQLKTREELQGVYYELDAEVVE